jgi:hypothetical protein
MFLMAIKNLIVTFLSGGISASPICAAAPFLFIPSCIQPHEHFDVVTINLIISPVPVSNTWCAFIRANELFASNTESFVRVLLYAEDCIINSCMEIIVVTFYMQCRSVITCQKGSV